MIDQLLFADWPERPVCRTRRRSVCLACQSARACGDPSDLVFASCMNSSTTHSHVKSSVTNGVRALKHGTQHFACQRLDLVTTDTHRSANCCQLVFSGGSSQWPVEGTVDPAHMETPVSGPAEGSDSEASFNCSY